MSEPKWEVWRNDLCDSIHIGRGTGETDEAEVRHILNAHDALVAVVRSEHKGCSPASGCHGVAALRLAGEETP